MRISSNIVRDFVEEYAVAIQNDGILAKAVDIMDLLLSELLDKQDTIETLENHIEELQYEVIEARITSQDD